MSFNVGKMLDDRSNNPYVHDPFYFAKNPQINSFKIDDWVFVVNFWLATAAGAVLNLLLLFLIFFRTPVHLKPYGQMLLLCCCADLYYLLIDVIFKPHLMINDGCLIYASKGIVSNLTHSIQCVMTSLLCGGMLFCCTVLPAQFYYRYCLMVKNVALSLKQTFLLGLVAFSLATLLVAFDTPAYMYSALERPTFDYGKLWYSEAEIPVLMIMDSRSVLSLICIAYAVLVSSASYSLAFYFFWKTIHEMSKTSCQSTSNDSTRRLQTQFSRVLIIQGSIPLFSVVLPILSALVAVFFRFKETGVIGDILVFNVSWLPVLNPFCTILLLPAYRKLVFKFFCTGKLSNNFQVTGIVSKDTSNAKCTPSTEFKHQQLNN